MPRWDVPQNIAELVAGDPDQMWWTDAFSPIRLTVMGGTIYYGRPIELSWQIEFEPANVENERAIRTIKHLGLEEDGYGWCTLVASAAIQRFPELKDGLFTGDTDQAACVIWVETEEACRKLISVTQELVTGNQND